MKKILIYILPAVLFISSCSQNSSNPNVNTGCNVTPVPNTFIEINFNGGTHRVEGYDLDGQKLRPSGGIGQLTDPILTEILIAGNSAVCPVSGGFLGGQDNISLEFFKIGSATIGTYGSISGILNLKSAGKLTCKHTSFSKSYTIDSTLSVNVTNISTDFIAGTFTCKVKDATSEFPATGSFNVSRGN